MNEIIFLVEEDLDGGYIVRSLNDAIFTQADDLIELRAMVKDAVHCHCPDEQNRPQLIRLHKLI
jgi:predicted RNase H-like HicB family nuclease